MGAFHHAVCGQIIISESFQLNDPLCGKRWDFERIESRMVRRALFSHVCVRRRRISEKFPGLKHLSFFRTHFPPGSPALPMGKESELVQGLLSVSFREFCSRMNRIGALKPFVQLRKLVFRCLRKTNRVRFNEAQLRNFGKAPLKRQVIRMAGFAVQPTQSRFQKFTEECSFQNFGSRCQ